MSTAIMVHFPKPIYLRLKRQAKVFKKSIDQIVVQTVKRGLPLWLDEIPQKYEQEISLMGRWENPTLQAIIQSKLAKTKQRKLDKLLAKNRKGPLRLKEQEELDQLQLEVNLLTLKKAKALFLVKKCARSH